MNQYLYHRTNTDELVKPLDAYMAELDRRLAEAYWTDNIDEVERLQQRLKSVQAQRDLGEEYWTAF